MLSPDQYQIICRLFPRIIGAMYFVALFPFLFQIRGLLGKRGILPVERYLAFARRKSRITRIPTVFWWKSSDAWLFGIVAFGVVCALLLAIGATPWLLIALLILVHLSLVTAGQDFLSFGWEMFFLEISYNTFFLSLTHHPNLLVLLSLNLLIFRFYLQAGASKLQSYDPNWRNLTALSYHYQTQPLPHVLAWYLHKLPMGFHRLSTAFMFFVELIVPFAVLGTEEMRLAAFLMFFLLQFFIILSGNYSYLNYLTIVLVSLLISDTYLSPIVGPPKPLSESPLFLQGIASLGAMALIFLQLVHLWDHFFPRPWTRKIVYKIYPYHFANRYGIFAIMTTTRYEIVIKGSDDKEEWKEYLFYFKPSEVERRPRLISPFQPRLDWQAWFLPFDEFENQLWFQNFLIRLLEGESTVLSLLRTNPFPDKPPKYLKVDMYVYQFTPGGENWWERTFVGGYSPVLSLNSR